MSTDSTINLRPRTAGEILDDAWRLALAEAPVLLALSGLFAAPAFAALLLLLARPSPESVLGQMVLPALVALLLPVTGLGSAACQELFRRRAAGEQVTLGRCLLAALRRGPQHAAGRALTILGIGVASLFLVLPGMALWVSLGTLPAILTTGDGRLFPALRDAARDAQRRPISSGAVILSRLPLLLLAAINLVLLIDIALWTAGNLAGLEIAFLDMLLTPLNPIYAIAVVAISWLALTPYFEASTFLLHLDNRVRYEGIDLAYRIRSLFRTVQKGKVAALLLAFGTLAFASPAHAADARLTAVREVRQGVQQMSTAIADDEKFPGDGHYLKQLSELSHRVPLDPQRGHWFDDAVRDFAGQKDREGALRVLEKLDRQLAELEDSLTPPDQGSGKRRSSGDLKKLLPTTDDKNASKSKSRRHDEAPKEKPRQDDPKKDGQQEEQKKDGQQEQQKHLGGGGEGAVAPQAGGAGMGAGAWLVLGGLAVVILVVTLILFFVNRDPAPAPATVTQTPAAPETPSLEPDVQSPNELWGQTEKLARRGEFLAAVRYLYLAVLTLLHQADLIRYEKTRTNGEYLRQLRSTDERGTVVEPFRRLTGLFEQKWYGERSCAANDFESCMEFAEALRAGTAK